jgi:hypothetical protein
MSFFVEAIQPAPEPSGIMALISLGRTASRDRLYRLRPLTEGTPFTASLDCLQESVYRSSRLSEGTI